jgi:2-oxoglutarate ferredoxin oxidoreductase subunit beta
VTIPVTYEPAVPIWCAGCGHFGVLHALQTAIGDLEIPLDEVLVLAGIGCSGTIQNSVGGYGYHALHGRVLPAATGVALANPGLTVIGAGGDGDGYAIGAGHLVHAFRRNASFTYVLMNNETYGLTKGQRSPSRLLDHGGENGWLDGPLLGVSIPTSTFVARGYSGWYEQLTGLARQALEHARGGHGFAFLEVVSPCVTYEDTYPRWEHVLHDVDADPAWDPADRAAALAGMVTLAADGRLPAGVLFRSTVAAPRQRPVPASEPIDPAEQRERYAALLDRYAVAPR